MTHCEAPRRTLLPPLILLVATACASGPSFTVIERADGLSRAPDWAKTTVSTFEDEGRVHFVGFVSMPSGTSISAGFNAADEKAMSEPTRSLVSQFLDQNGVAEGMFDVTGQRVISALRNERVPMPGLEIKGRYYERVQIDGGEGRVREELRIFSLAAVPVAEFQAAKQTAFNKLRASAELKGVLDDVAKRQRDDSTKRGLAGTSDQVPRNE